MHSVFSNGQHTHTHTHTHKHTQTKPLALASPVILSSKRDAFWVAVLELPGKISVGQVPNKHLLIPTHAQAHTRAHTHTHMYKHTNMQMHHC